MLPVIHGSLPMKLRSIVWGNDTDRVEVRKAISVDGLGFDDGRPLENT